MLSNCCKLLLLLSVLDITAPVVSSCPSDMLKGTDTRWKKVNWTHPVFTDNVGVMKIVSNKRSGEEFERSTSLRVRYVATDAASNKAYCEFIVTIERTSLNYLFSLSQF